jgi:hypothetical protein
MKLSKRIATITGHVTIKIGNAEIPVTFKKLGQTNTPQFPALTDEQYPIYQPSMGNAKFPLVIFTGTSVKPFTGFHRYPVNQTLSNEHYVLFTRYFRQGGR